MKQQLTEALARLESEIELHRDDEYNPGFVAWLEDQSFICAAARLVEGLLPGECGNCHGDGHEHDHDWTVLDMACLVCHGAGQVWDEGIVEVVAKAMHDVVYEGSLHPDSWETQTQDHKEDERRQARFVLSVLVELLTEKVET